MTQNVIMQNSNQISCEDNMKLMSRIPDNHVDLIYCDVLYGTGRKFKDYQDLKPKREVIEEHYIPRIKEMHRILKDTGSIYLQMDTRINHWVRCIMDDIFGYDKFCRQIIWDLNTKSGYKSNVVNWIRSHDIIIMYTKSDIKTFNKQYLKYSNKYIKRFNKDDGDGRLYRDDRPNKKKQYLEDSKGTPFGSVWNDIMGFQQNSASNEWCNYDTQKPKTLIERIIKASSNEGDLVADFYLGSGTTAEVCQDLKRNFIGCDINQRAIEITKNRLAQTKVADAEKRKENTRSTND